MGNAVTINRLLIVVCFCIVQWGGRGAEVDESLGAEQPWEQRLLSSYLAQMKGTIRLAFNSKHSASLSVDLCRQMSI